MCSCELQIQYFCSSDIHYTEDYVTQFYIWQLIMYWTLYDTVSSYLNNHLHTCHTTVHVQR